MLTSLLFWGAPSLNCAEMPAGVEEYTAEHWAIMQPERLGFKGKAQAADAVQEEAEANMRSFFEPHNAALADLMAAQGWDWQPFA